MIRWHSTTCKTCAHYLWNQPSDDLVGYGCAVMETLALCASSEGFCPSFLEQQYSAIWLTQSGNRHRLERLPDYAGDQKWRGPGPNEESAEWTMAGCPICGEQLHICTCQSEDEAGT